MSVDTEVVPVTVKSGGGGSRTISQLGDGSVPRTTSGSGTISAAGPARSKGDSYKEPGSSTASFGINKSEDGGSSRTDFDGSIGASGNSKSYFSHRLLNSNLNG